ncbi:MAG: hypothetical protein ABI410_22360, partial [Rhodoferax sp.]
MPSALPFALTRVNWNRGGPTQTRFSAAAAWFCLLVGCVVLLGWLLQVPALTSIVPGLETMKVNAALCFVFAGGSLLFSDRSIRAGKSTVRGTHRRVSVALAV